MSLHTIEWNGSIDAAHFIPGHPKCGRLHGHTYTIRVVLVGNLPDDKEPAYMVDYGLIKEIVNELDHKLLVAQRMTDQVASSRLHIMWGSHTTVNEMSLDPKMVYIVPEKDTSAELLSKHLWQRFTKLEDVEFCRVEVSETPKTKATYGSLDVA